MGILAPSRALHMGARHDRARRHPGGRLPAGKERITRYGRYTFRQEELDIHGFGWYGTYFALVDEEL